MEPTIKIIGIKIDLLTKGGIVNWEQTFLDEENNLQSEIHFMSFPIYPDVSINTADEVTDEYVIEHIKKSFYFKMRCK